MTNQYLDTMILDNGDILNYLPRKITMPAETAKYWTGVWQSHYTLTSLAYKLYGNKSLYWLIIEANNYTNPFLFSVGRQFKVLLPEFLNEIVYHNGIK